MHTQKQESEKKTWATPAATFLTGWTSSLWNSRQDKKASSFIHIKEQWKLSGKEKKKISFHYNLCEQEADQGTLAHAPSYLTEVPEPVWVRASSGRWGANMRELGAWWNTAEVSSRPCWDLHPGLPDNVLCSWKIADCCVVWLETFPSFDIKNVQSRRWQNMQLEKDFMSGTQLPQSRMWMFLQIVLILMLI